MALISHILNRQLMLISIGPGTQYKDTHHIGFKLIINDVHISLRSG
jgi:hypothetical protein